MDAQGRQELGGSVCLTGYNLLIPGYLLLALI